MPRRPTSFACESCSEHRRTVLKRGDVFICARCHAIGNTDLMNRLHLASAAKDGLLAAKDDDLLTVWRLLNAAEELLQKAATKRVEKYEDELNEQRIRGERPWPKSAQ